MQQNSDTTFRLYDYGRSRELHLDRAVAVASGEPYGTEHRSRVQSSTSTLVDCEHFRLDRVVGIVPVEIAQAYNGWLLALPLAGEISVCTNRGGEAIRVDAGKCMLVQAIEQIDLTAAKVTLLVQPN